MNLILFESAEIGRPLPRADRRAAHLMRVLRCRAGDTFDAGIIHGARGKGTVAAIKEDELTLTFAWDPALPAVAPITLVVGLTRPQTARDILREATALGVGNLHFVRTDKSEPSYAHSTLWSSGEWRRHVLAGAEQAFDTQIPAVTHGRTLAEALAALTPDGATAHIALDNYESPAALGVIDLRGKSQLVLALGAERGWSQHERQHLRGQGFALAHLGPRVLRTETACIAALSILRAKLGLM